MRLQIVHESAHPRSAALGVGPNSNIFVDAFENGASQLEFGINLVNGSGPLKVERCIILRHRVFAVRFLAHLDIGDRIAALLDVGDLRGRVVGRAVEHGHWNHRRQIVGESAGEEEIEASVLVASRRVDIGVGRRMPGIDGGRVITWLAVR